MLEKECANNTHKEIKIINSENINNDYPVK